MLNLTIYEPRLLQILFNLLLIINYRFIITQLTNRNNFTINKLLQVLAYAFFDHLIS